MGDRIGVLNEGQLVQVGTPYEVYNFPRNTFVASFVGAPTINLFDATVSADKMIIVPEKFEVALQSAARAQLNALVTGCSTVRFGVRPEHVKLASNGEVAGTLYGAEDHGVEMILTIRVADHLIRATAPPTTRVPLNESVRIAFVQDKMHFFDPKTTSNLAHA